MSPLNTTNPAALQALMSETIFGIDFPDQVIENAQVNLAKTNSSVTESDKQDIIIKSLGANQKNILFIIEDSKNDFFSKDAELAFVKTLNALKLNLTDVAIINHANSDDEVAFDQIKEQLKPMTCVFLGFDPKRLGVMNCAENILVDENNIQFLNSFSFEEMLTDTAKKRMFWDAIKLMNF